MASLSGRGFFVSGCTGLSALLLFSGCAASSASSYVVTLVDGTVYHSSNRPELDDKTGYYKFRDHRGKDVLMRKHELRSVVDDS